MVDEKARGYIRSEVKSVYRKGKDGTEFEREISLKGNDPVLLKNEARWMRAGLMP